MEIRIFVRLTKEQTNKVKNFERENFYAPDQKTPEHLASEQEKFFSRPKAWILAFEGDEIIGRILLHKRKITCDKKKIILGGIGGVCTRRDKRKRGLATMLLERAIAILKDWNCDIAYLCADVEKTGALYSRAGFVPMKTAYTFYGRSGRFYKQSNGMLAPLNSPRLFEEMMRTKHELHIGNGNW